VLNLGRSRIVSVHAPSARQIINHPRFKGDVRVIDFSSITRWGEGGWGRGWGLGGRGQSHEVGECVCGEQGESRNP
jgi:hypothetical protein